MDNQLVQAFGEANHWILVFGIHNNCIQGEELRDRLTRELEAIFHIEGLAVTDPGEFWQHLPAALNPPALPPLICVAHITGSNANKDLQNFKKIVNIDITEPLVAKVKAPWPIYEPSRRRNVGNAGNVINQVMIAGKGTPLTSDFITKYGKRLLPFRMQFNPLGHVINGIFHPFGGAAVQIIDRQDLDN